MFLTILTLVAIAGYRVAFLDGGNAANIDADRRVELERPAAGGGFGVAKHDADLFADLVDEDERRARLGNRTGELAQGLGHEPGLQADMGVAHFAVQLGLGHQRGNRVDHQHVDSAGAHQGLSDFQGLFARVRLRNQQVVDIYAQLVRVSRVEGVLGIDKCRQAAQPLCFGDDLQA